MLAMTRLSIPIIGVQDELYFDARRSCLEASVKKPRARSPVVRAHSIT